MYISILIIPIFKNKTLVHLKINRIRIVKKKKKNELAWK